MLSSILFYRENTAVGRMNPVRLARAEKVFCPEAKRASEDAPGMLSRLQTACLCAFRGKLLLLEIELTSMRT